MSLQHCPDLCLLEIFDALPLNHLVQSNSVCHRWNLLRECALRRKRYLSIRVGKQNLEFINKLRHRFFSKCETILDSEDGTQKIDYFLQPENDDQLFINCLNNQAVDFTKNYFTNITSLEIVFQEASKDNFINTISLLNFHAPKLSTLKLSFRCSNNLNCSCGESRNKREEFQSLLDRINQLPVLKKLTFEIFGHVLAKGQRSIDFPILAKLEEFHFNSNDYAHIWINSLLRYGQNNAKLEKTSIGNRIMNSRCIESFRQLPSELASKFTYLDIKQFVNPNFKHLRPLFRHFSCLTSLSLYLDDCALLSICSTLKPLKRLNSLRLYLHITNESFNSEIFQANWPKPLTQIKSLTLIASFVNLANHQHLNQLNLSSLFPNVKIFKIDLQKKCLDCHDNKMCTNILTSTFLEKNVQK